MNVGECRERARRLGAGLTVKQRAFCRGIVNGLTKRDAAREAGYSERSAQSQASKMLEREAIVDYIAALEELAAAELGITPGWVIRRAAEVYDRCMQASPHLTWDSAAHAYVPDGLFVFDARNALGALKLLGDTVGGADEVEKTVKVIFGEGLDGADA